MTIKVCDRCGDPESETALRLYFIPDFGESVSSASISGGERVYIKKVDLCPQCAESLKESLEVWQQN